MDGWLTVGVAVALGVLVLIGPLVLLPVRRGWLARAGGCFECSVRTSTTSSGTGWTLGMARYNDEAFEWFRFFSFRVRPRLSLLRTSTRVSGTRDPEPDEATVLYAGARVVEVEEQSAEGPHTFELAMNPDSLTGLLSWLEAAPPGVQRV